MLDEGRIVRRPADHPDGLISDLAAVRRRISELPLRQRQVLDLLIRGCAPKQIACELGIRWNTVRNHIVKLRARFGAESNVELVVLVVRAGGVAGTKSAKSD
jgi:DNA-binding CsgD family transcriptional regulator